MEIPHESPVPIIDPFVSNSIGTTGFDVPMPRNALRDDESLAVWPSSDMTGHLFKSDEAKTERMKVAGDLDAWIANLDRWKVHRAGTLLFSSEPNETFDRLAELSDRIFVSVRVDPHEGMRAVKRIGELAAKYPMIKSISMSPMMTYPAIAPNSKEYYPIYTKCCEENLAVFVNVGFPGPRVPAWTQDPIHLDEVCWFFPELRVIMRHGGEPWVETCIRMLLRWPNLFYATTGFAPRFLPEEIINFLNGRGRDKVLWAGYWPMLGYDRIFEELSNLNIKPDVLPKFLHHNAVKAFALDANWAN